MKKTETKLTKKQIEVLEKLPFSMQEGKRPTAITARAKPALVRLEIAALSTWYDLGEYIWRLDAIWRATPKGDKAIIEYHPQRERALWEARLEKSEENGKKAGKSVAVARQTLNDMKAERSKQSNLIRLCNENIDRLVKAEQVEGGDKS